MSEWSGTDHAYMDDDVINDGNVIFDETSSMTRAERIGSRLASTVIFAENVS